MLGPKNLSTQKSNVPFPPWRALLASAEFEQVDASEVPISDPGVPGWKKLSWAVADFRMPLAEAAGWKTWLGVSKDEIRLAAVRNPEGNVWIVEVSAYHADEKVHPSVFDPSWFPADGSSAVVTRRSSGRAPDRLPHEER